MPSRFVRARALAAAVLAVLLAPLAPPTAAAQTAACPCTIWDGDAAPAVPSENDTAAVEVGVKFRASEDGVVTDLRFYKGQDNTGTHVGHVWTATGELLASATFTGETATGWQQVTLPEPVSVTAGQTYVASYHAPNGGYAIDDDFFASQGVVNGPLEALADGVDGGNGVYAYGAATTFPSSTWRSANYWVDVVFEPGEAPPDTAPPAVTGTSPVADATGVGVTTGLSATFDEAIDEATLSFALADGAGATVAGAATYDPASTTASFEPDGDLVPDTTYTAAVEATDTSGNAMPEAFVWSFTTGDPTGGCPCSVWSDADTPSVTAANDPNAVELGVKVRSSLDGYITGIRFYKGDGNSGPHVGNLWSTTGALLASASFASESPTGWQQVAFSAPVPVTSGTTYVASYYAPNGSYAFDSNYFAQQASGNESLEALQDGVDGGNGVYRYGASGFPAASYRSSNYWVDVVFDTTATDSTAPSVVSHSPYTDETGVANSSVVRATFDESIDPDSLVVELTDQAGTVVDAAISYDDATWTATLDPTSDLAYSTSYTASVTDARDRAGNELSSPTTWSFATADPPPPAAHEGPGGPVLVLGSASAPFSRYYSEILRAEGFNLFTYAEIGELSGTLLDDHDVAILGEVPVSEAQVALLTNWVEAGGNLIAMRPDPKLHGLMGISVTGSALFDGYLKVDTTAAPGAGIVAETVQYHGPSDRMVVGEATPVADLYSDATTPTTSAAVTMRPVGANGGEVAAFGYDLARSVVYTRQGNPAWAGQERDGFAPRRSDDMFFGGAVRDWIDLDKVAIPQADEQQRLLANLVLHLNRDRKPLPRFWYFPSTNDDLTTNAVVVATGDDHGNGGSGGRFERYDANSPAGCSVGDWECLRLSSYLYTNTPLTDTAAAAFHADGFEVGLHVTTYCGDYTQASLASNYSSQLSEWRLKYASLPSPTTNRTHCIAWSDWSSQADVALANGVRFDTNYYYWPDGWVQDRPGFFTGSGMPMRFARSDGSMVDVFQAVTQMTDESGQSYPFTPDALLDRALGSEGYYGAFTANMHTDSEVIYQDDALVASALSRGVPVVTSRQMLTWVDGRNASSFSDVAYSDGALTFGIDRGSGGRGLTAMLPTRTGAATLTGLTRDGAPVTYVEETVKGVHYAVFEATAGSYRATYVADTVGVTAATLSSASSTEVLASMAAESVALPDGEPLSVVAEPTMSGLNTLSRDDGTTVVEWLTDEPATSTVRLGLAGETLRSVVADGSMTTHHRVEVEDLAPGQTYQYVVESTDFAGRAVASEVGTFRTRPEDRAKPSLSRVKVLPLPDGTATVTWRTNEGATSEVLFGRVPGAHDRRAMDDDFVTDHHLVVTHLEPATEYSFQVRSLDRSGNRASSATKSFVTPEQGVVDSTAVEFRLGDASATTYRASTTDGDLQLAPAAGFEFDVAKLPAGLVRSARSRGGDIRVHGGAVAVDGATLATRTDFKAGGVLEGEITFEGEGLQEFGFADPSGGQVTALFRSRDGSLYATVDDLRGGAETPLGENLVGEPHVYRIEWKDATFAFSVDGELVATHTATKPGNRLGLRLHDGRVAGGEVIAAWVRNASYASAGTYTSRVLDSGAMVNWGRAILQADVPEAAHIGLAVRTGNTPRPDGSWTAWTDIDRSGDLRGAGSRYLQYRLQLKSSNQRQTPVVEGIGFTHDGPVTQAEPSW